MKFLRASGILLFLCISVSTSSEPVVKSDSPPPRQTPKDVAEPMLEPYYVMANWFLDDLVQMSYLYDLEEALGIEFTSFDQLGDTYLDSWEEYNVYLIGFVTCAAVGVVLIIGMPIAGGITACCRCCGNCDSNTPSNVKASNCKRYGCGIALLIVTASLAFGTAGVFIANEEIKERLAGEGGEGTMGDSNVFAELSMSIDTLDMYVDSTLDQLNTSVLGQYIVATDDLFDTLENIPQESLSALDDETGVVEDLTELTDFTFGLPETKQMMIEAGNLTMDLNKTLTELEAALEDVKAGVLAEIVNCTASSPECQEVAEKLNNLKVNVSTDGIDFANALVAIDTAITNGIITSVNESIMSLQSVVDEVAIEIQQPVEDIKRPVNNTKVEIAQFLSDLEEDLDQIDFESATKSLEDAGEATEEYVPYVYWSILSLGIILCVTLLCNVVGTCLGMFCSRPTPGESGACSCDSARGSDWLLAGLTLTFVFYWLYVLIVVSTFLAGGITHTELCTHAVKYENENSARVLQIFDRMINNTLYDSSGVQLEVFSIYGECADNISFYQALELEQRGYNISDIVDLSDVEESISKIKDVDINIPPVNVMDQVLATQLQLLDTGLASLTFEEYYEQLSGDVVSENLDEIAEMLKEIDAAEGTSLDVYAQTLKNLTITHVMPADNMTNELIQKLEEIEAATMVNLTAIAGNLTNAEATINSTGDTILQGFLNDTADEIFADVVAFSDTLETDVRENVGKCYPMFDAMTLAIDATCVKSLYAINGFWYALGWILFWFFPSIILSFCLVKEFRIAGRRYKSTSFDEPYPQTIDAYTPPNPSHMLIEPGNNSFVAEFDNPIYDNTTEFKIPRPSLRSSDTAQTDSSEFKIPRPQLYDKSGNSSPPSYRSVEEDSAGVNPSAEDTKL